MNLASIFNPSVEETVGAVVWALLALGALAALRRQPVHGRGAWIVVAAYCAVVVVDKVLDLQMVFYEAGRAAVHWLVPERQRHEHHSLVSLVVALPLTAIALVATLWLVRRDRALDRAKWLALTGLGGVLAYVGIRVVPEVGGLLAGARGLVVEALCVALVAAGEAVAIRSSRSGGGAARR